MGKAMEKLNAERKRQRFSKEFKLNAVALLKAGQKPGTHMSPTISAVPQCLRPTPTPNWFDLRRVQTVHVGRLRFARKKTTCSSVVELIA